jgi:hypothetical protein
MAKYILLQNRKAKVPLLGTKSKPYNIQINKEYSASWYGTGEAWLVTMTYLGNKDVIARNLRSIYSEIAPDEIDHFIDVVKKDHPLEHILFNWSDIPLYATDNSYCEMNIWLYKQPIKLTLRQEKELLGIVQDKLVCKKKRIINWFKKYRQEYGIDAKLKRDKEIQDEELAALFCLIHGFELESPDNYSLHNGSNNKKGGINGCLVFVLIFFATFCLLLIGNESDSWMVGILCAIPFFLVVGGIANFLKRE